ncbi:MAG: ABC transporter permease subunit [Planctomycetes bacterium]|nr:ABC transporter permease subunit [Planctomycetota bacterium]
MPSRSKTLRAAAPALLVALPLILYLVYPLLVMFADAFRAPVEGYRATIMRWDPKQQPFAAGIQFALADPIFWRALGRTALLSVLTVVTGVAWGGGLALLWHRRAFPGRRFFALIGYAPVLMPPLVGTIAFYALLGNNGLLWRILSLGTDGTPMLSPFLNVLLLHTYAFGLFAYAFLAAALSDLDPSHEEAVRSLGGSSWKVLKTALWPALRAPLAAAALFIFMAAGASFSGPYLLDTSGIYLSVYVVDAQGDTGFRAALTVALVLLSFSALPAFLYFQRRGETRGIGAAGAGLKGAAGRALAKATPTESLVRLGLSLAAAAFLLAPLLLVALGSLVESKAWTEAVWPKALSFEAYRQMPAESWNSLQRSLLYGGFAAGIDVLLALGIALALRRAPGWAAFPAEAAVMLALALPGTAVAVALLSAYNAPSWLTGGQGLGATGTILVLAYAMRYLPLAVRPARAALVALGGELELAARGLGASGLRTTIYVVLPLIAPSLLAAGLLCFVSAVGEYVASVILQAPHTQPVSVVMGTLLRQSGTEPQSAALAVLMIVLGALAIGAAGLIQRKLSWSARPAKK